MKLNVLIILLILISSFGCSTSEATYIDYKTELNIEKINKNDRKYWYHQDIIADSIPGISLDRAYKELLHNKKADTIIIAVLDTGLDINHNEFVELVWTNADEIPNNNIDDDNNGYIDDTNGWNFLGNANGENVAFTNYMSVRMVRKFDSIFNNKSITEIHQKDTSLYKQYQIAKIHYQKRLRKAKEALDSYNETLNEYDKMMAIVESYFPNDDITIEKLENLEIKNKDHEYYIQESIKALKYNVTRDWFLEKKKWAVVRYEKHLGVGGYDESQIIGDNPDDINDVYYGNNNVKGNDDTRYHSTQVTGVLAGNRDDGKGVKGILNNVKIMPLRLASRGSERDKDIALAIRYAVDNGAKIINMSFRNDFSTNREWVDQAIKYADINDVLLISAAGNEGVNTDIIYNYPDDQVENQYEFSNNFIVVGSTSYKIPDLVSYFSNYGKKSVDIFAPGESIYTSTTDNKYIFVEGTSVATPIVSGVAALIRSYYPNLTAAEVKQIIMKSGVSYDIMVNKPSTSKQKELVPFSSLSKSGKIVNAYNALLLAEKVSKSKRKSKK